MCFQHITHSYVLWHLTSAVLRRGVCVCAFVCVRVSVSVSVCLSLSVCVCVCVRDAFIQAFDFCCAAPRSVCMCVCACACARVRACVHEYTYGVEWISRLLKLQVSLLQNIVSFIGLFRKRDQ